ncbi:hypothetical protein [Terrimonas alba]|uniref:hypothetical protein n=1 Tax=Terrimonas alba TaxID=3349636 RepID=UPI0035F3342A
MRKILFILVLLLASMLSHSQYIHKIKADSVLITNDSCNAELNLENSTKHILGFLYNKGNGRTEFRKSMIKVNDSVYVFGGDTLRLGNLSGSYIQNQNASGQNANFWITGNGRVDGKIFVKDAAIVSSSNSSGYDIVFNSNPGFYQSIEFGFPSNPSYQNKGLKFIEYQGASWVWADGNNGANNRFLKVGGSGGIDIFTGGSTVRLRAVANTGNILIGKTTDDSLNKLQVEGNISVNTTLRTPNVSGTNIIGKTLKIAGEKVQAQPQEATLNFTLLL